jgi:pimeloyl-ACP methyl ester carboxylesterase
VKCVAKTFNVGINLLAKCWGDPSHPPMLALHGWLDNANSFDLLAPYLSDYYIIAVDFPGHGLSEHIPAHNMPHFNDLVYVVARLLEVLAWEQCVVLGHSMGAGVATLVAGVKPELFSHVILLDCFGPLTASDAEAASIFRTYLNADYYYRQRPKQHRYHASLADAIQMRVQNSDLTLEEATILAERGTIEHATGYAWRHDRRLLLPSPNKYTAAQVRSFVAEITAKICYIYSTDYVYAMFQEVYSAAQQLVMHQVNASHHMHMREPQQVAQIIQQFLTESDS